LFHNIFKMHYVYWTVTKWPDELDNSRPIRLIVEVYSTRDRHYHEGQELYPTAAHCTDMHSYMQWFRWTVCYKLHYWFKIPRNLELKMTVLLEYFKYRCVFYNGALYINVWASIIWIIHVSKHFYHCLRTKRFR